MYKAFEISYFMDVSFFSISLFTVLEQLGIGGYIRVAVVIGWCRLDHCNSYIVSNRFLWFSQRWTTWNWRIQLSQPSAPWSFGPRGSWLLSFSSSSFRRPVAQGILVHPSHKSSIYQPFNHLLTEVGSRPPLISTYQARFPELKLYFLESLPIWSPH